MTIGAYFDESGTHPTSPVMSVSGYLIEETQAQKLETEWKNALGRYEIDCFHMVECAHGTGEFAKLSKSERSELCRILIGIITRRAELGISASMCESDLERAKQAFSDVEAFNSYTMAIMLNMVLIGQWLETNGRFEPVTYVFEKGHTREGAASNAIRKMTFSEAAVRSTHYSRHSFIGKKDAGGLQAADLLAWEFHQEQKRALGIRHRNQRLSFANLVRNKTHYWRHFEEPHIRAMIDYLCRKDRGEDVSGKLPMPVLRTFGEPDEP